MNNSLALPRLQRLHNSQSIRMRGAILQITVNNNLPPSAPLPSLKQCFIAFFFSICICHPRGPLFDLSPPVSASPGSRWPVDWQLRSDIWWDEASTGAPRRQKQTSGVFSPSFSALRSRASAPRKRSDPTTRWRKVQANISSTVSTWGGCGEVLFLFIPFQEDISSQILPFSSDTLTPIMEQNGRAAQPS